jgi:hypothetical protein
MFQNRGLMTIFGGKWGKVLLENYHRIEERKSARPTDLESYAGGSVSSW